MKLEKFVKDALIWNGTIKENWRINIISMYSESFSTSFIEVEFYKPRKKKASGYCVLVCDTVRKEIDFNKSEVNYF